ncbi:MAG: ABC transporter ATP-binding protein [Rhodospirillaceae bacterium]|jgi:putative ABC transport system ATP-binding protein|nr:ABC transporter ATP-binding protein [Rhodospirillaceae bacterium]MBT7615330.1 ABC transporter ATP-binding protein [Rhodospirillaceae bacterium]MBT7647058.1 ABC transporter ATP-binding protein [Rhodospirillaceae bacterium]
MSISDPIVHLTDVALSLTSAAGPVNILHGVSLSVERGHHVAVIGPSGSGKSSLLAITAGLERPTSGRVEIAGQDLASLNEDRLAQFRGRQIGIVFQAFHLVPTMTALENVALPLELAGERNALERSRIALGDVGLGDRTGHLPTELSGGEQQRVALARALIAKPPLLLADEPTGNLDGATGETIVELIFEAAGHAGATLVLVTHNAELAGRCSRTVVMEDGRLKDPAG